MKGRRQTRSDLGGFSSGASLGGKVSRYRRKQNIYAQGAPAYTLFYIRKEECGSPVERNTKRRLLPPSWAWAISLVSFASQATPFVRQRPSR